MKAIFWDHIEIMNSHGGKSDDKNFSDYFEIQILKAYKKPFTMLVEEGTYISNHKGELLNSKSEWHQAKIIRTTTQVIQGGADLLRQGQGGRRVGLWGAGQDEGGVIVIVWDQPQEVRQGKILGPVQQLLSPSKLSLSNMHVWLYFSFLFGTEIATILSTKDVYQ